MSHATQASEAQISLLHAQASHLCRRNATTAASGASQWITGFHVFFPSGLFSPNLVDRRKGRIQWRLLQPWPAGGHLASWPLGQLFTGSVGGCLESGVSCLVFCLETGSNIFAYLQFKWTIQPVKLTVDTRKLPQWILIGWCTDLAHSSTHTDTHMCTITDVSINGLFWLALLLLRDV